MAHEPTGAGAPPQPPPQVALLQLITAKWAAQAVCIAAELGVADHLHAGPTSADDVASKSGAHPDATYRLMRALTMFGVLVEHEGKRFTNTPLGDLLREDHPASLRSMARFQGHEMSWRPWMMAHHSVRTGTSSFEPAFGEAVFDWAKKNPEPVEIFNRAMTSMSAMETPAILASYDFSGFKHVVDVGGGHGALLAAIVEKHPAQRGTVFDMGHAKAGAEAAFRARTLSSRVTFVPGDFFSSALPAGADLYVSKHILHDWSDEACVQILSSIHKAAAPGATVLTFEALVPPPNVPHVGKLLDLEMLVMTNGGRERTEAEFAALYAKAGLRFTRVIATPAHISIIEGHKP